jgi:SAM-dependent methyltransferase
MDLYTAEQGKIIGSINRSVANLEQVYALTDEDYARSLEIFEASSDQRSEILNWLKINVLSQMPKGSNSILSIGCGTGAFDEQILQNLIGRMKKIKYLGIEPNKLEAEEFEKRMQMSGTENTVVDSSVLVDKFGNRPFGKDFDLVLLVHSIYYLDDRNDAIDAALDALSPGGVLIIVVAPDESLNVIANQVWQRQMGHKSFFSDDLRLHFDNRGIEYSETRISAKLNVTNCFNAISHEGRDIIDFTVQARTGLLPEPLQKDIFKFLLSISEVEAGNTYLPHPVDIFRCKKDS